MRKDQEGKDMSVQAEKIKTKRELLWELAEKNTKRNKDGLTVLTKDCPYREEENWRLTVKKKG